MRSGPRGSGRRKESVLSVWLGALTGLLLAFGSANAAVLTHGPVVGGVTHTSANVFARTDGQAEVAIRYSARPDLAEAQTTPAKQSSRTSDFTGILTVSGLLPETAYYYTVLVDGADQLASPYPSFQTFPAPGAVREFNVVIIGDTGRQSDGIPYGTGEAFRSASTEAALLMLQTGDFDHRDPKTLDEKRTVRKSLYDRVDSADFVALTQKLPFYYVWDDHDYGRNNANGTAKFKRYSKRVYGEYVPSPPLANPEEGIWHNFRVGQTEFFMLDNRTQRCPNQDPDDEDKSMLDCFKIPGGQKEWLKESLVASTAVWKIIVSPSVWNPTLIKSDSWHSFKTERQELLDFFGANGIRNIVILSGDVHWGAIDDGTHGLVPQLVVPNTNMTQHTQGRYNSAWTHGTYGIPEEDGVKNGYGKLTFSTDPHRLLLEVKNEKGVTQLWLMLTAE